MTRNTTQNGRARVDWRMLAGVMILLTAATNAWAQGGRVQLPNLDRLAKQATESVDITLDTTLLALAARFMNRSDPDEQAIKEMLEGVKGLYVRSFEFAGDGVQTDAEVDSIRSQFSKPGWNRLVGVTSSRERSKVDVYAWLDKNVVGGIAVLAAEPRKFTIVNLVGSIDLDKLRRLEGKLGIPKLGLDKKD